MSLHPSDVFAYSSPGKATGYVNDFAGIISNETKQYLEGTLTQLEASTSAQVAVVTIKSLDGDVIENYTEKLFKEWQIGQKGKDNGILLLVARDDRKLRIEVGYGLEGTLTDLQSGKIIRDVITPRFKENNYDQGIKDGVDAIRSVIQGDSTNAIPSQPSASTSLSDAFEGMIGLFFFGIFLLQWFISILARSKSWWLGGVIGGVAGGIFSGFGGLIGFGLVGLFIDFFVSHQFKTSQSTGSYPWWIGGKSGFGGGSSSGGGGFGGFGGGRSGGGGASGGW